MTVETATPTISARSANPARRDCVFIAIFSFVGLFDPDSGVHNCLYVYSEHLEGAKAR
jgi:hypothetical protein